MLAAIPVLAGLAGLAGLALVGNPPKRKHRNARHAKRRKNPLRPSRNGVLGSRRDALLILDWHGGQGSACYRCGSNWIVRKKVPAEAVRDCYDELVGALAHAKESGHHKAKDLDALTRLVERLGRDYHSMACDNPKRAGRNAPRFGGKWQNAHFGRPYQVNGDTLIKREGGGWVVLRWKGDDWQEIAGPMDEASAEVEAETGRNPKRKRKGRKNPPYRYLSGKTCKSPTSGLTYKVRFDTDWQEWQVAAFKDGKYQDGPTYHAMDKADALDQLAAMAQGLDKRNNPARKGRARVSPSGAGARLAKWRWHHNPAHKGKVKPAYRLADGDAVTVTQLRRMFMGKTPSPAQRRLLGITKIR